MRGVWVSMGFEVDWMDGMSGLGLGVLTVGNAAVLACCLESSCNLMTPSKLLLGGSSNIIKVYYLLIYFATSDHIFSRIEVLHFDRRIIVHGSLRDSSFPSLE